MVELKGPFKLRLHFNPSHFHFLIWIIFIFSLFNHLFLGVFVQNLVVGRAGQCGLLVAALAEAEVAREDEHAPHPHPPMVGQTVWGGVRKERPAKCKTAVSKNQPITSYKLPVSFELICVSFVCPLFRRYGKSSGRRAKRANMIFKQEILCHPIL